MDEKDFYSIKEFAILLGVHANTIRRSIKNGKINGFKIGVGKKSVYRISHAEINRIAIFDLEEIIQNIIKRNNEKPPV